MASKESILNFDRPSDHGALMGDLLAMLYEAGLKSMGGDAPDKRCSTCAFRKGTMASQCAGTTMDAFDCTLGLGDNGDFNCHSGIGEGQEPKAVCQGYVIAKLAPVSLAASALPSLLEKLSEKQESDTIQEAFDSWFVEQYGSDDTAVVDFYDVNKDYMERDKL